MVGLDSRYPDGKLVIFSAPSGTGKTTIVKQLLAADGRLAFSVSATSRAPRGQEQDGVDYFFMSDARFREAVDEGAFVEWEEVYGGTLYGTLVSEVERLWSAGKVIVFDVDVMGGIRLKKIFGSRALSLFIQPPSLEELRRRLEGRGTDSQDKIEKRLAKAGFELEHAPEFDRVVVNDDLDEAVRRTREAIDEFIKG